MTTYRLPSGPAIIGRRDWGARFGDGYADAPVPAEYVWLHHSATVAPDLVQPFTDDDAAVRTLERIGQERFNAGISYTFAATPVGRVYQGHSIGRAGTHTLAHNFDSRAIVLVGNYSTTPPTAVQIDHVAQLLAFGAAEGWWRHGRLAGGHRDANPGHTECPGNAAERVIPEINARATWWAARLAGGVPVPEPIAEADEMVMVQAGSGIALVVGDQRYALNIEQVRELQAQGVQLVKFASAGLRELGTRVLNGTPSD